MRASVLQFDPNHWPNTSCNLSNLSGVETSERTLPVQLIHPRQPKREDLCMTESRAIVACAGHMIGPARRRMQQSLLTKSRRPGSRFIPIALNKPCEIHLTCQSSRFSFQQHEKLSDFYRPGHRSRFDSFSEEIRNDHSGGDRSCYPNQQLEKGRGGSAEM